MAVSPLVIVELTGSSLHPSTLNTISAAQKLNQSVSALILSSSRPDGVIAELEKIEGVDSILVASHDTFENPVAETFSPAIEAVVREKQFSHILFGSTTTGKNIMPRSAALCDSQPLTDIFHVQSTNEYKRSVYAGNIILDVKVEQDPSIPQFMTVKSTAFPAAAGSDTSNASVVDVSETVNSFPSFQEHLNLDLTRWVSAESVKSDRPPLTSASYVVSGGRALKSSENFDILYTLADSFGGTVGASRAAVDAGFAPNDLQVGQTGKSVAPDLYIAAGISGAMQHLAGMKDSNTIVAINTDPEAPIFGVADYGIVGDLFKVVPELTEKVQAKKA